MRLLGWTVATASLLIALGSETLSAGAVAHPPVDVVDAAGPAGPVVVVGIDGAAWSATEQLSRFVPRLTGLADRGPVGSLSVRTGQFPTCPVDGWLTVSAGRRAIGPDRAPHERCPDVPAVAVDPTSVPVTPDAASGVPDPRSAGRVVGWEQLRTANADSPFAARIGSLSEAVSGARSCVTAVGPGAALAAAGPTGDVDSYVADPRLLTRDVLTGCAVTIVDAGSSAVTAEPVLGLVTSLLPAGATLIVVGVDDGPVGPVGTGGLRVAAAVGPGFAGPSDGKAALLDTDSTRWPGLVQLTDVAPTVLASARIPGRPATFVGSRWTSTPAASGPAGTLAGLRTDAVRARVAQDTNRRFAAVFAAAVVLLLLAALALGRRRERDGPGQRWAGRLVGGLGLVVAAAPVATRLASLVPWASAGNPELALPAAVVGWALAVAAVAAVAARATAARGRRRRRAATLVAATTVAVVTLDLLLGSPLQRLTVIGLTPIRGDRFYGMGNEVFAATAVCLLFGVAALAACLPDRAVTPCCVAGAGLVAVDGLPSLGADVGAVPAVVVGFGVAALALGPVRPRVGRVLLVAGAVAVVLLGSVALAGSGGEVVARKATAATAPFLFRIGSPVISVGAWIELAALVVVAVVVARPRLVRGSALAALFAGWPQLRPCLLGAVALGAVGFALNDSGVGVPLIALGVGAGLVVASLPRAGNAAVPAGRAGRSPRRTPAEEAAVGAGAAVRAGAGAAPGAGAAGESWEPL